MCRSIWLGCVGSLSMRKNILLCPTWKKMSGVLTDHDCSRRQIMQHFSKFSEKIRNAISWESSAGMIFHENRLPADDSHEISCLICYFWKSIKIWNCRLLQVIGWALWVNCFRLVHHHFMLLTLKMVRVCNGIYLVCLSVCLCICPLWHLFNTTNSFRTIQKCLSVD